jgi:alanyl-tRNA synthetase
MMVAGPNHTAAVLKLPELSDLMTHRYYYNDAYRVSFQAEVLETVEHAGRPALVLEGTYFYPTSGGQPFDTGSINSSKVVDVLIRPNDGAILHVLDSPLIERSLSAQIEWSRRFDHMQQHSGQHILSQAFLRVLDASTVSFHLGDDTSTIDLDLPHLKEEDATAVERLSNQIIWENRAVEIRTVSRQEAMEIPMRKKPPIEGDTLRLVVITDFDVSACGGTHVANTGEVGVIKIIGWERRHSQVRVEFVCGSRALSDYREKNRVIRNLSATLTTGYWELESSVARQIEEVSELRRQIRKCRKKVIENNVTDILNEAAGIEDGRPLVKVFTDITVKELRIIANQLIAAKQGVSLLAAMDEKTTLVFAKSEDSEGDMNALIKDAFSLLGSGSGGGSPRFAQGSCDVKEISKVIDALIMLSARI